MGRKTDLALGVLNGAVGDYLVRTGNGLALPMAFIQRGQPLTLTSAAIQAAMPDVTPRIAILVHGLMNTQDVWLPDSPQGFGARLMRDVGLTPFHLRYNSGLPIAHNGAQLSQLLDTLVANHPVPVQEVVLLGYSMGGLVLRAACHVASLQHAPWLGLVKRAFYLGTPHRGAPMERAGRVLTAILGAIPDPYTQLIAQLADLRSEGLQDLGDADLTPQDRARQTVRFTLRDKRHPVPLLPGIHHHLIAGSLAAEPWLGELFGDAVVPVSSASGHAVNASPLAREDVVVMPGVSHLALPEDDRVYAQLQRWLEA